MSDFEWKVGDDDLYGKQSSTFELDGEAVIEQAHRRRFMYGLFIALLIVILAGAAFALFINQRIDETTSATEADILAVYDVVHKAVVESDTDLYISLASDSMRSWLRDQTDLLEQGLLFDRSAFGLNFLEVKPQIKDMTVSDESGGATVRYEVAYTLDSNSGDSEQVTLQYTDFFRLDEDGWRHAPPPTEFWGDEVSEEIGGLRVTYPQRDRNIVAALSRDLDAMVGQLCISVTGTDCPTKLNVQIKFLSAPFWLTQIHSKRPLDMLVDQFDIHTEALLPTPTLVGLPVDQAGYLALYHGYALNVASEVFSVLASADYKSSAQTLHSIWGKALVDLGLRVWPPSRLDLTMHSTPIPVPDQDILVLCHQNTSQGANLYRYNLKTRIWTQDFDDRNITAMYPQQSRESIILVEQLSTANGAETLLIKWRDIRNGISSSDRKSGFDFEITSPDGLYSIVGRRSKTSTARTLYLFESDRETLTEIDLGVNPFWIDNETYSYVRPSGSEIILRSVVDGEARVLAHLNDMLSLLPDDRVSSSSLRLQTLLPDGKLLRLPLRLYFSYVVYPTTGDNLLFVHAREHYTNFGAAPYDLLLRNYVFALDLESGEISMRLQSSANTGLESYSRDGRWLAAITEESASSPPSLLVHDIVQNQTRSYTVPISSYASYDWSANNDWLLMLSGGVLSLVAPDYDYHTFIVPETPGCAFAAWVQASS